MKRDPFAGIDQRLFSPSDKSRSHQVTPPVAQPPTHIVTESPAQLDGHAVSLPNEQSPESTGDQELGNNPRDPGRRRIGERHTYTVYQDQDRWISHLKLDLVEQYQVELTGSAIVQLAIDRLRDDFVRHGRRSAIVSTLVFGEASPPSAREAGDT